MKFRHILFSALLILSSCSVYRIGDSLSSRDLSPYQFGLAEAKTGMARYNVLLRTHQAAVASGVNVDYRGINLVELEIPDNAERIPLTAVNDFRECVFVIKNIKQMVYLFDAPAKPKAISVLKTEIDKGDFRRYPELATGNVLLLIKDGNSWVDNRAGFDYGHQRKDILLLHNGVAQNRVIMPYNNEESAPICRYIKSEPGTIDVRNLTIRRTADCSAITNVLFIVGKRRVRLSNVKIYTPENDWRDDRAIRIEDCTDVSLDDVLIDGTYSQTGHSGYGIRLNNVWNFSANRLVGKGNWGVFGNVNVSRASIKNSEINRFDIHCYGRDVSFLRVAFSDRYNQLGSVYGTVEFDKCTFTDFDPLVNGASYNAYVRYDVYVKNCTFNVSKKHNTLLRIGKLDGEINSRKELREKCWPNLYIKDLTVNMDETTSDFIFITSTIVGNESPVLVHGITKIEVNGLTITSPRDDVRITITPKLVNTSEKVDCSFRNVSVNGKAVDEKEMARHRTNIPLKGGKIRFVSR